MNTKPPITLSDVDADRLDALLDSLSPDAFPGKTDLETELNRAEIVDPQQVPANVVTMNSTVKFRVSSSQDEFELTLVYPKDADSTGRTLSILAPVGSALIGLSRGDTIEWPRPGGGTLSVAIEEIMHQPEQAGEYHR